MAHYSFLLPIPHYLSLVLSWQLMVIIVPTLFLMVKWCHWPPVIPIAASPVPYWHLLPHPVYRGQLTTGLNEAGVPLTGAFLITGKQ